MSRVRNRQLVILRRTKIIKMINTKAGTLRLIVFGIRHGRRPSQVRCSLERGTVLEDSTQKVDL